MIVTGSSALNLAQFAYINKRRQGEINRNIFSQGRLRQSGDPYLPSLNAKQMCVFLLFSFFYQSWLILEVLLCSFRLRKLSASDMRTG